MAFCNKLGCLLNQMVSQNGKVSMTSTLGSLRYISTRLFIGGLSPRTDEQSLRDAFSNINGLTEARVMTNKVTGKSRGYGYVSFMREDSANSAMSAMDGQELNGSNISVNVAKEGPMSTVMCLDKGVEDEKKSHQILSRSSHGHSGICSGSGKIHRFFGSSDP